MLKSIVRYVITMLRLVVERGEKRGDVRRKGGERGLEGLKAILVIVVLITWALSSAGGSASEMFVNHSGDAVGRVRRGPNARAILAF